MARSILYRNCVWKIIKDHNNNSHRFTKTCKYCISANNSHPAVIHDRQKQRFTMTFNCDGGVSSAVLKYTFTGDKQVELMSTDVPESYRGKGVAGHLAKAALDFVVKEDLKARISCWYIRKYVDENPDMGYQAFIKQ